MDTLADIPGLWAAPLAIAAVWFAALVLDQLLGEPRRWHPLVGFGNLATVLENRLNRSKTSVGQFLCGLGAYCLAVLPVLGLLYGLIYFVKCSAPAWLFVLDVTVLYLAIGWRSLREHVGRVANALATGRLEDARQATAMIVSRDTTASDEPALTGAALETSLENSSDALFASLFWYAVGGSLMVVLHRLANTLDAMWGYRNVRFLYFGRVAARADDVLNFFPAQCVSLCFCLLARSQRLVFMVRDIWWQQGWHWKSLNAGSVMATGAAALGICLGGVAVYHGVAASRPVLGCGREPQADDIARSVGLVNQTLVLWFAALPGAIFISTLWLGR